MGRIFVAGDPINVGHSPISLDVFSTKALESSLVIRSMRYSSDLHIQDRNYAFVEQLMPELAIKYRIHYYDSCYLAPITD